VVLHNSGWLWVVLSCFFWRLWVLMCGSGVSDGFLGVALGWFWGDSGMVLG
jgi:hypothetical protein